MNIEGKAQKRSRKGPDGTGKAQKKHRKSRRGTGDGKESINTGKRKGKFHPKLGQVNRNSFKFLPL